MKDIKFIHLRVHSAYSLLEGALPLAKILEHAKADHMPAVCIADTGNLFGALEFSEKAQAFGIQPIIGCQMLVDFAKSQMSDSHAPSQSPPKVQLGALVMIAASETGFRNLSKLVGNSFLETKPGAQPHVDFAALASLHEGLICLSGGPEGAIDPLILSGNLPQAEERLERLFSLFGDRFYIELQRHGLVEEKQVEKTLIEHAYAHDIPLVATQEPFFAKREDFEAHDALIAIAEGRVAADDSRRKLTPEHYFKTRAEMAALFADLPEALENTIEIAQRCCFRPVTHAPILPNFLSDKTKEAAELRKQARDGLKKQLEQHGLAAGADRETYEKRLEYELGVIEKMNYAGYFLIVADFIQWAKAHDIAVGPGRGSGAGSLVAYALTITDIDPLRFSLLFERFLNPERVSMPDFDIDFCQNKRDRVIEYVQQRYGTDQVAQIITFGTLQPRAVLRDVGRVLQMPYSQVDRLCKLVPAIPTNPVTLEEAIASEPRLQEAAKQEDIVERLFSISIRLEGLYRHASTHAAGIVIADRPLEELVPLYRDPRSDMPVTQYNMKWVEQAGLVKFDFLGLKTLTILEQAVALLKKRNVELDLNSIPLDDKAAYDMLSRGEVAGIFQLESQGMRRALMGMKPDRFEDIIALVALYRPGPMENIPTYNRRKHGLEAPDYMHPKLEEILKETYGVIIYQEQVMQIAQKLSGYSLGEADLLRRAMGKKIRSEMAVQRKRFVEGAVEHGTSKGQADMIFDLVARFADYGFNKSHAAAYALIAYQTAFVKANYPVEFLAASMTLDMGNTDKLSDFCQEAARMGISIVAPCINRSSFGFEVQEGKIIYALGALKGVGHQVIDAITTARAQKPFSNFSDFIEQVGAKLLNKRTLEALICAGAFDGFTENRARLMAGIDIILAQAQRMSENRRLGQNELFAGAEAKQEKIALPQILPWKNSEKLVQELKTIGFYLSAHPLDEYTAFLEKHEIPHWAVFQESVRKGQPSGYRLAGTVISKQERRTRNGSRVGIVLISDPSGQFEGLVYAEKLFEYRDLLEPGRSFIFTVGAELDAQSDEIRLRIQDLTPLEEMAKNAFEKLQIFTKQARPFASIAQQLKLLAENSASLAQEGHAGGYASRGFGKNGNSHGGRVHLILILDGGQRDAVIELPGEYQISPALAEAIETIPGVLEVSLH